MPDVPKNILKQQNKEERIYNINSMPDINENKATILSNAQYEEFLEILKNISSHIC